MKWEPFRLVAIEKNHGQTVMHETTGLLGYMLVSPKTYGKNVIVSYVIMTLNPATVIIVEMAAYNRDHFDLKLHVDYDGNVKYMFENINMYMFAFHNAAHNKKDPFVRNYPKPGSKLQLNKFIENKPKEEVYKKEYKLLREKAYKLAQPVVHRFTVEAN